MTSINPREPRILGSIVATVPTRGLRALRGLLREAPLWPAVFRSRPGKAAAFLPSKPRAQSSLLRIYAVAESLRDLGWTTLVLPATLDLAQRRRLLARFAPDVIVMQGARHELNRPALYPGFRIAYDMDDADFHLPKLADEFGNRFTKGNGIPVRFRDQLSRGGNPVGSQV